MLDKALGNGERVPGGASHLGLSKAPHVRIRHEEVPDAQVVAIPLSGFALDGNCTQHIPEGAGKTTESSALIEHSIRFAFT